MKNMSKFILFFVHSLSLCSQVGEASDWSIRKERLFYKDAFVDTSLNIDDEDLDKRSAFFRTIASPLKDKVLLKINDKKGKTELWIKTTHNVLKVDMFPFDMNVRWSSNNYFMAYRKSMGTSITYIYRASDNVRSEKLINVIYFDTKDEFVARLVPKKGNIGEYEICFSMINAGGEECVATNLKVRYLSDLLGGVNRVVRTRDLLFIEYQGEDIFEEQIIIPHRLISRSKEPIN